MPLLNSLYFRFRNHFSTRWPRLYHFCERHKEILKFFFAGCLSGGSDLVFLFIMHGLFKMDIVLSTSVAFILSFGVSFFLQKFWTFRNDNQDKMVGQLSLYFLFAFVGLNLNGAFMHLLVNAYNIWYILAQIIVNLVIASLNFLTYKFIIFRNSRHEINCEEKTIS